MLPRATMGYLYPREDDTIATAVTTTIAMPSHLPRPPALAPKSWPFMALRGPVTLDAYPVSRKFFFAKC